MTAVCESESQLLELVRRRRDRDYEEPEEVSAAIEGYLARVTAGRKGTWMLTLSGVRFFPEDPRPEEIRIQDIAAALARLNRFGGHIRRPYSVAEHSVWCSLLVEPRYALFALLHDAGEAYLGDVITPVKRLMRHFYEPLEEGVMAVVAERFGFDMSLEERGAVKLADMTMLAAEVRDLTVGYIGCRLPRVPAWLSVANPRDWLDAEWLFLQRFEELYGKYAD